MNPREKILRTELVSAGAALLCCLLLCIACFLLAGLPSASLILLAAALPLSLVILPCALTWYSGRFWPIILCIPVHVNALDAALAVMLDDHYVRVSRFCFRADPRALERATAAGEKYGQQHYAAEQGCDK